MGDRPKGRFHFQDFLRRIMMKNVLKILGLVTLALFIGGFIISCEQTTIGVGSGPSDPDDSRKDFDIGKFTPDFSDLPNIPDPEDPEDPTGGDVPDAFKTLVKGTWSAAELVTSGAGDTAVRTVYLNTAGLPASFPANPNNWTDAQWAEVYEGYTRQ
jgi:hypothetical protein